MTWQIQFRTADGLTGIEHITFPGESPPQYYHRPTVNLNCMYNRESAIDDTMSVRRYALVALNIRHFTCVYQEILE